MDLRVNKDSRGADTVSGPAIDTKQITTQVLVKMAALWSSVASTPRMSAPRDQDSSVRRSALHRPLFKNTQKRDDKTELLIFVTPRILKDTLNLR